MYFYCIIIIIIIITISKVTGERVWNNITLKEENSLIWIIDLYIIYVNMWILSLQILLF